MSYEEQLKESQPTLKSFVESKIFNKDDAGDIIQNANQVALNKRDIFDKDKSFEAWIIGIAKYQIKDYLKKNKKKLSTISLDIGRNGEAYVFDKSPQSWLSNIPFSDIVAEERRALWLQIRARLTKKQILIFDLTCQGFSPKQISKKLDMKARTVSVLKTRLIQRAKRFINQLNTLNGYDYRNNG